IYHAYGVLFAVRPWFGGSGRFGGRQLLDNEIARIGIAQPCDSTVADWTYVLRDERLERLRARPGSTVRIAQFVDKLVEIRHRLHRVYDKQMLFTRLFVERER